MSAFKLPSALSVKALSSQALRVPRRGAAIVAVLFRAILMQALPGPWRGAAVAPARVQRHRPLPPRDHVPLYPPTHLPSTSPACPPLSRLDTIPIALRRPSESRVSCVDGDRHALAPSRPGPASRLGAWSTPSRPEAWGLGLPSQ